MRAWVLSCSLPPCCLMRPLRCTLRPFRSRVQLKAVQTSVPPDTELMVTVQRALNLPQRRSAPAQQPSRRECALFPGGVLVGDIRARFCTLKALWVAAIGAAGAGRRGDDATPLDQAQAAAAANTQSVCAFVEVRFRGLSTRTVTSSAGHPTFNEMVRLWRTDRGRFELRVLQLARSRSCCVTPRLRACR